MEKEDTIQFIKPAPEHGAEIHRLIQNSPPLDCNSVYNYLLLCTHFSDTCICAVENDTIFGFISGYIIPDQNDTLFIWQVAVSEGARGRGIASKMIKRLLKRKNLKHIHNIETTVTPSNNASASFFRKLSKDLNTECNESPYFLEHHFGKGSHEQENLFKIGRFDIQ